MRRRGPDAQRFSSFRTHGMTVLLLHSRLSIIDVDPRSDQPFDTGGCILVYNGEIYNYVELREELKKQGVTFRTTSDTEVLLQCYLRYGERCVEKFEGMWAFAIYDSNRKTIFLSRDRFGEKPLWYLETEEGFYFASEIKCIAALSGRRLTVNTTHLLRYLVNGYKSLYKGEDTFYREIHRFPAATSLVLDLNGRQHFRRYWAPSILMERMSLEDAVDGFRERLLDAVRIRLRSDVPLAFCLSGGVDSGALVSIAAKVFGYDVMTFSIVDRDERYNELSNIEATIRDTACKHFVMEIPRNGFFERLSELIAYHDEPLATISYYIHSFLTEKIGAGGYRVAISGTGADEMVTGYYDHFNLHLYEMRDHPSYQKLRQDWERHIRPYVRNPFLMNPELYFENLSFRGHIYLNSDVFARLLKVPFSEPFVEEQYTNSLLRNRMLNELFHEAVPVILHEDDLNSMYYSVENRSPYLDSRLFAFCYSIPDEFLIRDGYAKYILRQAVAGILNEQVRTERRKKGFNASIHSLVDLSSSEIKNYLLSQSAIFDLVDKDAIARVLDMRPMPNSYSKFTFNFINAKLFLEQQRQPYP